MAEVRINTTGTLKLFDADDSHSAGIAAGTITADATLMTLNTTDIDISVPIDVTGSSTITVTDNSDTLTLKSTDDDASVGPVLVLQRDSSSPADNDLVGKIQFKAEDTASNADAIFNMGATITDVTGGSEDMQFEMTGILAGTLRSYLKFKDQNIVFNEDSQDIDFRVESNGNAFMIYVDGGNDHVNIGTSTDLGGTLNVSGTGVFQTADNSNTITLISTDADDVSGPRLSFQRQSGSPADADLLGQIFFTGKDDGGNNIDYATIVSQANDVTDGTEDGILSFQTVINGTLREGIRISDGGVVVNELSNDIDFRVESNNNSGMFFVNAGSDHVSVGTDGDLGGVFNVSGETVMRTAGNSDTLTLKCTDTDADLGPVLRLSRDNDSASASDVIGKIIFTGEDAGNNLTDYAEFLTQITDASDGSEDIRFIIKGMVGGNYRKLVDFNTGETSFNDDSDDVDFRVESNGNTHMLFIDAGNDHVNVGTSTDHGGVLNIAHGDNTDTVMLVSTDADGSTGPNLTLYRKSSSPADADDTGIINFRGRNDNSEDFEYAQIKSIITDASDGSEDGTLELFHGRSGQLTPSFRLTPTEAVINDSSNDLDFRVESNGVDKMLFVNANDNTVSIGGEATPLGRLHVFTADSGASAHANADELVVEGSAHSGITIASGNSSTGTIAFADDGDTLLGRIVYDHANNDLSFGSGGVADRMIITSAGQVSIGATGPVGSSRLFFYASASTPYGLITQNNATTGSMYAAQFLQNDGSTELGSIKISNTATAFNTSSDYRLKENVVTDWDATTRLKQLKPSRFNFIADADTTVDGFLAHEVSDIVPEAISGEKDATETYTDDDGKQQTRPAYQGIDQSKLVPLLVKTVQELEARIATLEDA